MEFKGHDFKGDSETYDWVCSKCGLGVYSIEVDKFLPECPGKTHEAIRSEREKLGL